MNRDRFRVAISHGESPLLGFPSNLGLSVLLGFGNGSFRQGNSFLCLFWLDQPVLRQPELIFILAPFLQSCRLHPLIQSEPMALRRVFLQGFPSVFTATRRVGRSVRQKAAPCGWDLSFPGLWLANFEIFYLIPIISHQFLKLIPSLGIRLANWRLMGFFVLVSGVSLLFIGILWFALEVVCPRSG